MKRCKHIYAVDSHTMGEPTRVVTGGLWMPPGASMRDRKDFLAASMDYVRTSLMLEPRGHRDMFGAVLCEPVHPEADLGVVFMDGGGYLDMCGHGSIGATTVALEMGFVEAREPETRLVLDTPAGLVQARAVVRNGCVESVTIRNVPAFVLRQGLSVESPECPGVEVDIAYGGNCFALVEAASLGLDIVPENADRFVEAGMRILAALRDGSRFRHPATGEPLEVSLVEFTGPARLSGANARNIVVFGRGQVDRSPCGTGTCARMAALYAAGRLPLDREFIHESVLGTTFSGRLVAETRVGCVDAVVPEITGRAFLTGMQDFLIDDNDPLKYGFTLGSAV